MSPFVSMRFNFASCLAGAFTLFMTILDFTFMGAFEASKGNSISAPEHRT